MVVPPLAFALLSPGFAIAGLALAAVPVVIHLLNRRRHRIVEFAAMHLLLFAVQQNRRRLRMENWLLLALRCLMIVLLGVALSHPVGCDKGSYGSTVGRNSLHVFVIDNSFATAYHNSTHDDMTQLDSAKRQVAAMINGFTTGESVAIIPAAKPAFAANLTASYDLQQARDNLGRIQQHYGNADLAVALQMAEKVGSEASGDIEKHLYIFSGATASEWQNTDGPAIQAMGPKLAQLFTITHVSLSVGAQSNQAIVDLSPTSNLITASPQFGSKLVSTIQSFGQPSSATIQWKVDGKLLPASDNQILEAKTETVSHSQTDLHGLENLGGTHVVTASLQNDDGLQPDNTRSRVINVVSQLKTLIVEGEHQAGAIGGSALNVKIALAGLSKTGKAEGLAAPELISDLELADRVLSGYRAVILCSVSQVTPAEADQLQAFVAQGGTLMIFTGDNIIPENYNTQLLARKLIPGPLIKRMITTEGKPFYFSFDPNGVLHPLLQAFAHQQNSGLETAQIFGYWQMDVASDPQLRVLNFKPHYSSDASRIDPAITSQTMGAGRIVCVATSANEQWITFTRKPIYTELVNELLAGSINANDEWMNLTVGDPLVIPATIKMSSLPFLTDPQSHSVAVEWPPRSDDAKISCRSGRLDQPGIYTLNMGTYSQPIAVNIPATASNIRIIEPSAIKAAMGNINLQLQDRPVESATTHASTNDWAWTVLLVVLCATAAEAFAAMRFGHNR